MKYRTSFASNSSSCSFCILGYECPFEWNKIDILSILGINVEQDSEESIDIFNDYRNSKNGFQILAPHDYTGQGYFVGVDLVDAQEYGLDELSLSWSDIYEKLSKIEHIFKTLSLLNIPKLISVDDCNLKIVSGQLNC